MSVEFVKRPPTEIRYTPDASDPASRMGPEHVQQIAEIFKTPLTGAYNWDYEQADEKIQRLYRLGKDLNWNAEKDIDWSRTFPRTEGPFLESMNPYVGFAPFESMTPAEQVDFGWHNHAWTLSQFLHGEQGALLVASQLISCAPTYDAKLYAASQTFDEARHVEVFTKYLKEKVGFMYPVNPNLKALLDKILTDERWDLKFIGMQLIIEGLALAAFHTQRMTVKDPVFKDLIDLVIRDEARHVAFGVTYLEQFVKTLSPSEIEDRAQFSYEACVVMRERLIGVEVFEHFGWDKEVARQRLLDGVVMEAFRKFLFTRIIPNLKKVGLLTDSVRPKYEALGILEFENLVDDGVIDWASFERPLAAAE
jgi:hypothetical protein